jgi:uncharacterized membrane protein YhhN
VRALRVYAAVAAADVVLAGGHHRRARWLTKPLLMPLLGAHIAEAGSGGRTADAEVLAGLGLSCLGDIALLGEGEAAFGAGLACFLGAHGCYIAALLRHRGGGVRRSPLVAGLYLLAWAGLSAVLVPRTGRLRAPVLVYGTALVAMALATLESGEPLLAAGGASFLVSDSILALGAFDVASVPGGDALVMLTYTAAQALITQGSLRVGCKGPAARDD